MFFMITNWEHWNTEQRWNKRWCLVSDNTWCSRSVVGWSSDLCGTTNIHQLWWQNFCSRWTSFVELFTGSTARSRRHLRTVSMTAEGTPFWEPWTWHSVSSDMQHFRKTFTYLLTYLLTYIWRLRWVEKLRTRQIHWSEDATTFDIALIYVWCI